MSGMRPERWGIVGGGVLGMTLAHRLARQGKNVVLMEAAPHLGGVADAWNLGAVVWDRHYHVTLMSDASLRSLLAELGLERELQWTETRTGFYTDGKLHSMSNTIEFLRFPPLDLIGKLRLGATIFYASRIKNWKRLEAIPVEKWLRRWSGSRTFEKIWRPLLRAKLGENYRKTSAAFIWGTIARMYAARRTGLKKEMFGYVPGGYGRVMSSFAAMLEHEGVTVQTGHAASAIESRDGRFHVTFKDQRRETFDKLVVTLPGPACARLCPQLSADETLRLNDIHYQGIVCASVLLAKPLAGFYVTNITDPSAPFTAVIEMSALVDRSHFGGNSLVYLPKYLSPDDPTFEMSDGEIENIFLAGLERIYPHFRRADVQCFRVSRVRHLVPISTLHYSERLPSRQTTLPGLHIVNSAHIVNGTLNVNETIQLAERAAAELYKLPHTPAQAPQETYEADCEPVAGPR